MTLDSPQYLSQQKLTELSEELRLLQEVKLPQLAQRIDDARQLGDLSENAEYHAAREEMAWAQSHLQEIKYIIEHAEVIPHSLPASDHIGIGSSIVVKMNGVKKTYAIVGGQEASPLQGKISNESPLGIAFLGHKAGDTVEVKVPSGVQIFEIIDVS
jgi:transcription elongation factor GreA